MLVLTRKLGEAIMIGDNVIVTVIEMRYNKIRLGIEAPREVPIHRREIWERIQRKGGADEENSD